MFLPPNEYTTTQLCRLAANREIATLAGGEVVRLTFWSATGNRVRVRHLNSTRQWTTKKSQVTGVQLTEKIAREMGLTS